MKQPGGRAAINRKPDGWSHDADDPAGIEHEKPKPTTVTTMLTIHETKPLGQLLDRIITGAIKLRLRTAPWPPEACAELLESVARGAPIGLIAITENSGEQTVADGRCRLQAILTATSPRDGNERFDFDLDSEVTRVRTRPAEGCGGRWFPAEALRWTDHFHAALAETTHESAEVTERRANRAHDLARRIEKECVPIARTVDGDEHARARIRTTLNRHRTRGSEHTANG